MANITATTGTVARSVEYVSCDADSMILLFMKSVQRAAATILVFSFFSLRYAVSCVMSFMCRKVVECR